MHEEEGIDKVQLKKGMIIEGVLYRMGSVIDRDIIPQSLRNRKFYSRLESEDSGPLSDTPTPTPRSSKKIGESKQTKFGAIDPRKLKRINRREVEEES